jgi:hypothetical protein
MAMIMRTNNGKPKPAKLKLEKFCRMADRVKVFMKAWTQTKRWGVSFPTPLSKCCAKTGSTDALFSIQAAKTGAQIAVNEQQMVSGKFWPLPSLEWTALKPTHKREAHDPDFN